VTKNRKQRLGKCWRSGWEDKLMTANMEANSDAICLGVPHTHPPWHAKHIEEGATGAQV